MHLQRVDRLNEIAAAEWDALVPDDNPFLSHAFLDTLERHGGVGEATGWLPSRRGLFETGVSVSCSSEFHSPQAGQRPSHCGVVPPQA